MDSRSYGEFKINIDLAIISPKNEINNNLNIEEIKSKYIRLLGGDNFCKISRIQQYRIVNANKVDDIVAKVGSILNVIGDCAFLQNDNILLIYILNFEFDKYIDISILKKIESNLVEIMPQSKYILDRIDREDSDYNSYYFSIIYPMGDGLNPNPVVTIVADTKENPISENILVQLLEYMYLAYLIEYYYRLSEIKIGHIHLGSRKKEYSMLDKYIKNLFDHLVDLSEIYNKYELRKLIEEIDKIIKSKDSTIVKMYNISIKIQENMNIFNIAEVYNTKDNLPIYIILDYIRDTLFEIYNVFSKIETDLNNFYMNINIHYRNLKILNIRFKKIDNLLETYKLQSNIDKDYIEKFASEIYAVTKIFDKKIEMLYTINSALIQYSMHNIQKLAILYYVFLMLTYLTTGIYNNKEIYITLSILFIIPVMYMYISVLKHLGKLTNPQLVRNDTTHGKLSKIRHQFRFNFR